MPPDSGNPTDNPSDFSYWFNNPDDADVLLQLSTSLEANGQQEQQLSVSAVVDEEQQQQQQLSVSAAVDGEQQQRQQLSVSAAVDGEQQQRQQLSVSAAVDGEQQQQQQLSVSAAVDGEQQQQQQLSVSATVDGEQQQQQQQQQQLSVPAAVDGEQQQQQQQYARSFHAHAIILRQRSAYFRSSLTIDWQRANQPRRIGDHEAASSVLAAAGVRYELVELVEADELDAMEELLRLMYSQKVPEGAPAEVLLQMLRLADRYQSVACTQLLLTHLAAGGKDAITLSVAAQLFSMPASVQMHPAFKSLSCVCSDVVVEHYSDVSAVIQSDELCQHFCKLPYAAVLAWAGSGQLCVHSENCVVYLLSAWVKAQQQQGRQGISAEQLEQLAHQVRVLQLGPAYQCFVLPHLEWFKGCSGMEHFHLLLAYKGVASTGIPVFPSPARCGTNGNDPAAWEWGGPAAWVAGPRQLLRAGPRSLRWDLGLEEVQKMQKGELDSAVLRTPHLYANGFQLRLRVTRELKEPGDARSVFLRLSPDDVPAWGAVA